VKNSGYEAAVRPGPAMGQDNERVFKGLLGMDEQRYRALVETQVIY
jgi:benzylsuccinate CoA-transferase BbsF subunit